MKKTFVGRLSGIAVVLVLLLALIPGAWPAITHQVFNIPNHSAPFKLLSADQAIQNLDAEINAMAKTVSTGDMSKPLGDVTSQGANKLIGNIKVSWSIVSNSIYCAMSMIVRNNDALDDMHVEVNPPVKKSSCTPDDVKQLILKAASQGIKIGMGVNTIFQFTRYIVEVISVDLGISNSVKSIIQLEIQSLIAPAN